MTKNKIQRFTTKLTESDRLGSKMGQSKPAWLYLLELRSRHAAAHAIEVRRKLVIKLDLGEEQDGIPKPVKIRHKSSKG
jgi:hypothetical protein